MNLEPKRASALTLLAAAASILAGCGESILASRASIATKSGRAEAALSRLSPKAPVPAGGIHASKEKFLPATAMEDKGAGDLPRRLLKQDAIRIRSRDPMDLRQILRSLADATGIPHAAYYGPNNSRNMLESESRAAGGARVAIVMRPRLKGSLPTVLDEIARHFGFDWKYSDGRIEFSEYSMRTYMLATLPTAAKHSAIVGTASSTAAIDLMEEIESAIESLAGPDSIVNFGEGTGQITLVARRGGHERVARYVDDLNKSLGRQISFDVTVLTVSLSRSENYGLDLGAAIDRGAGSFSLSGVGGASAGSGTVNIGFARDGFKLEAMVEALNRIGDVAVETRSGTTISNNGIAPVQVAREISFAENIQTVQDASGNVQKSIAPGKLVTGFEMHLLPRILNSREVLVKFTVRISDLNRIAEFTSDGQSIQLPEVSTISFEQQAILSNGQTLVLAGFERERTMLSGSGFPRAGIGFLGGRTGAEKERVATVLTIRPRIISGGAPYDATPRPIRIETGESPTGNPAE